MYYIWPTMFRKIFQNRNLTLLWLGQILSQSGDSIYQIGLLWLVLELSDSKSITGMVAMASYLPSVILSLIAGVIADRLNRKRIMLASDLLRFFLILTIPAVYLTGLLSPLFLGINAFIIAIAATFFNPSRDSFIPQIVPREGLLRANSLIQTSWQMALVIGPALAGMFLHYLGNINLFTACSLTYLLSFASLVFIKPKNEIPTNTKRPPGITEVKEGLVYAVKNPVIFPLLLITIADNIFIMGPAIVGTPVFIKETLGLEAEAYAFIMSCYAVGMLAGTGLLITFGGKFKKGAILLTGMFLDGITFVPLLWSRSLTSMAVIIIIHSMAIPMLTVSRPSLIQNIVPDNMRGRAFAMVNMAVVGMSAVSSGLAGLALEYITAPTLFFIIGIGGGLCGVIGWIFAKDLRSTP